jgi:SAM-dependent methyltransferase
MLVDGEVDFGKTAADYGRYRAGFPAEFFDRVFASGAVREGDALLDLGAGTGTLARGFAARGCEVTALDPSAPLLAEAERLARVEGVEIRRVIGRAEETGLETGGFDVVTAGQCWHWFDRPRAAAEARRLLRPGGCLVIAHFDWIPRRGSVVEATERLIQGHNPAWKAAGGTGIHPAWLADAGDAGFRGIETFSFDSEVPYSHEAWRGRIRASAGVAANLPPAAVAHFDSELAALLARDFPAPTLQAPHRIWAMIARSPAPE